MTKVSSTNLYQCLGGLSQYGGLLFQNTPCISLLLLGLLVTPKQHLQPVHIIYFGKRSKYYAERTLIVQLCSVLIILFCLAVK